MKIILALSSAIILLFSTSCKKDSTVTPYTCTSCVRTPEALAANDNTPTDNPITDDDAIFGQGIFMIKNTIVVRQTS